METLTQETHLSNKLYNNYEHPHHRQVFECVKKEIYNIDKLYCFDNYGRDLSLDQVKKKLHMLNFYKSQMKELGLIYLPMLEILGALPEIQFFSYKRVKFEVTLYSERNLC